jgi:sirohydrochlorin ferrochelatase
LKILVIAAHGSRKTTSNLEVEELTKRLASQLSDHFDRVVHAFLQMADPLLETTLDHLAQNGASHIVVFPFFIGSGSHIIEDIPQLIEKARQAYPAIDFTLTRHLGGIQAIETIIVDEVID